MNNKRLIITSVISIILISVLFIGSTYSIFTIGEVDENQNVYTTGNLSVSMESNGVIISDNVPVSDDESNAVYPTRITVTNNGTVSYKFNLILTDTTSSNPISSEYIKTKVGVLNPVRLSDTTDNIIKSDIVIGAGESVDIDVRVWLSDDIPSSELGKNFYAKLTIDGIGVYDDSTNVNNNDLSIAYMKTLFTTRTDYSYYRNDDYREKIKNAYFVNYIDLDDVAVDSSSEAIKWDVTDTTKSDEGTVVAWLEDSDTDGYYDLYIGSEKLIFSESLFGSFSEMTFIESIEFDNLDTSLTTNMQGMFYYCSNLVNLDVSSFNTSNVTNMDSFFSKCSSLIKLDLSGFNTSNVINMRNMFYECGSLEELDISGFNTSNVTNMEAMFMGCSGLTSLDVSHFNTSAVQNMYGLFYECSKLVELNVSNFNTSSVTNMSRMFYNCGSLTSLNVTSFNTSNVTDMSRMFYNCGSLTSLNVTSFDTSNVTDMSIMFMNCVGLSSLDLSSFSFSNVTSYDNMFKNFKTTQKIYVKDTTAQNWILDKGFANLSTDNVIVKS